MTHVSQYETARCYMDVIVSEEAWLLQTERDTRPSSESVHDVHMLSQSDSQSERSRFEFHYG